LISFFNADSRKRLKIEGIEGGIQFVGGKPEGYWRSEIDIYGKEITKVNPFGKGKKSRQYAPIYSAIKKESLNESRPRLGGRGRGAEGTKTV